MFEKIIMALILILAVVAVFSGCDKIDHAAESIEDAIENKIDPIEDAFESQAESIEDAAEQMRSNMMTTNESASTVLQDVPVSDEMIQTQPDPVQNSLDKIIGIVGDAVREQESTLHIADSAVDSAVSAPYGQPVFITPEEAKRIALNHAGVAMEEAVFDRTERDFDNGIYHYEVEFRVGLIEYEYEIHAETGRILSFDKDR